MPTELVKVFLKDSDVMTSMAQRVEQDWAWNGDLFAPGQFFQSALDSESAWTAERRLLLAILQNAVEEFLHYRNAQTPRGKRLFRETMAWFASQQSKYLGSFEYICAHLNIDPEYIRRGLKRLQQGTPTHMLPSRQRLRAPIRRRRHLAVAASQ